MNNKTPHLLPEISKIVKLPDHERIAYINKEKWIGYPQAQEILQKLDDLLAYPRKTRMPSMLIVGATNNGKTSLIKRFFSLNPPIHSEEWQETTQIPVISVQAPISPNVSDLYSEILEQFAVPYKNTDKVAKKEQLIKYYFGLCQLKMLIIDEIHNILSGPISKQKMFMNALKNLSNALQISIVLVGTKEALRATNTDEQINNRFKPVFLPKWQYNNEYLSLLASFERIIPLLHPSNLAINKEVSLKILDLSEGYIGEMVDLLALAAIEAIRSGAEKITLKELASCHFVRPSERQHFEDIIAL